MSECIDRRLLGTEKHLVIQNSEHLEWSDVVPHCALHLDGRMKDINNCLDTRLLLENIKFPIEVPKQYDDMARAVLGQKYGTVDIPWRHFMPHDVHQKFLKESIRSTVDAVSGASFDYFHNVWRPSEIVFKSLRPARIDSNTLRKLICDETCESQVGALRSFSPDEFGYARPPFYNRMGTRTGRLTVESGPQILTIKKSHRSIIESAYKRGHIISMDFIALEARVAYLESHTEGIDNPDVYEFINSQYLKGLVDRNVVKLAVLSDLFGMGVTGLSSQLGVSLDQATKFVNKLRGLFGTDTLTSKLRHEFVQEGFVRSRFGRKVTVPELRLLLNSFVQSSGVDVALLGFKSLVERISELKDVRPLMILHDDLIVDCAPQCLDRLMKMKTVDIPGYSTPFHVKIKVLNTDKHDVIESMFVE